MKVILDIEADNLYLLASKIHCVVAKELDKDHWFVYHQDDRDQFLEDSTKWTHLIGHNILGYDLQVLWKIWDIPITHSPDYLGDRRINFVDTLVLSQLYGPDRRSGHSLGAWGGILGFSKTDFQDWKEYSEEMLAYCFNDVLLTEKVYKRLQIEQLG